MRAGLAARAGRDASLARSTALSGNLLDKHFDAFL
jgi:hypothetical protein